MALPQYIQSMIYAAVKGTPAQRDHIKEKLEIELAQREEPLKSQMLKEMDKLAKQLYHNKD